MFGIFFFSKLSVRKEAASVEEAIDHQFELFDKAFTLYQQSTASYQPQLGVDFIAFDQFGRVQAWTTDLELPRYEQFLLSPNSRMLTTAQGEVLFKIYESPGLKTKQFVVAIALVRRNFGDQIRWLPDQYNRSLIPSSLKIGYEEESVPIAYQGTELFNVQWSGKSYYSPNTNHLILVLLVLLYTTMFFTIYQCGVFIKVKYGLTKGILALIMGLALCRGITIGFGFPSDFVKLDIFSATTFRFEWFYPTLGDAVLNVIAINIMMVFAIAQWTNKPANIPTRIAKLLSFTFLLIGYFSLYLFADTIQILLDHSQISLDISNSLQFSLPRILAYVLVSFMAIFYFLQSYLGFELLHRMKYSWPQFIGWQSLSLLCTGLLMYDQTYIGTILIGNFLFTTLLFAFHLPINLKKLKFESLNYLMLAAILLSAVGAYVIYQSDEKHTFVKMHKFATQLEFQRDLNGEYLLSRAIKKIEGDVIINSKMIHPQVSHTQLAQRIKHTYLNTYFSNYEIDVTIFNKAGLDIENLSDSISFSSVRNQLEASSFRTGHQNIYYDAGENKSQRRKFICLATLKRYQSITGYIKIELRLKRFSSRKVLPQLLTGAGQRNKTIFDYGVFDGYDLLYKSGTYDYESFFDREWMKEFEALEINIHHDDHLHYNTASGRHRIVITSSSYAFANIVSNFSFLFVVLLSLGSWLVLGNYLLYPQHSVQLSFSTKILLYTGASFIIPLVLVGVAVMTTTDLSNRKEIDKSNLKKAGLMTENLNDYLMDFNNGKINKEALENAVSTLSIYAGMDINLYGKLGTLLASSTPEIFDNHILSRHLAPVAASELIQRHKESLILDQHVGTFQYKSSFLSILSQDTGEFLGVLVSPYFASKNHLKRQQLSVFGNIINIFTFVFILSILIAYFIIAKITKPIVAIADRLHDTGFVETNQPIEWTSDDEIGVLVNEYNNMLAKLEVSKQELARTEKEAAWREMAKQVAHEIKNPLTPMKLTIQHLKRVFADQPDKQKSLDILLSQIDTLDEIVTSFNHFAKMPVPESEPFDIKEVLEKSIDLHVDKKIIKELPTEECLVMGDKKLFGRIFNNLILNGFQAMKRVENPSMKVALMIADQEITMTFTDYGEGISEAISDKIFIPNFSTKDTGSGIGLAVAKRGIDHAGGVIYFESEVGKGSSFIIKIPLIGHSS